MNRANAIIVLLLTLSLCVGAGEFYLNGIGEFLTERTQTIWGLVFVILTILWAIEDHKLNDFEAPFDSGFLTYIFWPIAFPYYLWATRRVEAVIYFAGFLALWTGPWLAGLVSYVYVYSE